MARGVVFHDSEGRMHKAYLNAGLRNEIVLSAGAMGSQLWYRDGLYFWWGTPSSPGSPPGSKHPGLKGVL